MLGRGEKLKGRIPLDIKLSRLVERYGALVLLPGVDVFALSRLAEISAVESIYEVAGTKRQKSLSMEQWEYIRWLDGVAAEEESA